MPGNHVSDGLFCYAPPCLRRPTAPIRSAVVAVLSPDLLAVLEKVEEQCRADLAEALAVQGRATDWLRTGRWDLHFEVMELELEEEHAALLRYHFSKLTKRIRWVLEARKDTPEEE